MRHALAIVLLVACSEPAYHAKPLPPLVVAKTSKELTEIVPLSLGFVPGDSFTYTVRVRGFAIGSATVTATATEIKSHFGTSMLAQAFTSVSHDLVTKLGAARPLTSMEQLSMDGKARQFATDYSNTTAHSLHTAMGAVRAWAKAGAPAGYLRVVVMDKKVRVELQEPSGGKGWLRVDGKIVGLDDPATFTCWLNSASTITRIDIKADGEQVTAELVY